MEPQKIQKQQHSEITIDIGQVFRRIADKKWTILIITALSALIGVATAINMPNEYVSQVQILPELESKDGVGGLSKFKSLAGLAGVDLSSFGSTEAVRPDLYPNILQSTPFLLEVLDMNVYVAKTRKNMVLAKFLDEGMNTGILVKIFGRSDEKEEIPAINVQKIPTETIRLDRNQDILIKELQKRVVTTLDKKTGVITMTAKMQDPLMAAVVARYSQDYLTKYVVNYRTEKTKKDITFLNDRMVESKRRYDNALYAYSSYQDRNKGMFLNIAKDEGKKLQYEVDLTYNLYSEITKQLEEAKIKIHKETPIFKVLEPAQIPVKKSEPKRSVIVLGFAFLGVIVGVLFVLLRNFKLSDFIANS